MAWIGNDIVDLKDPQAQGKGVDDRFLSRVCAPEEKIWVKNASDPHTALWALWAMKEAAYKASKKKDEKTRFIPSEFVCFHEKRGWRCSEALIKLFITREYVHAIATISSVKPIWKVGRGIEVRELTLNMLEKMGYSNCEIRREKKGGILLPPQIFQNGSLLLGSDVSLSHDGRYVATALSFSSMSAIASPTV